MRTPFANTLTFLNSQERSSTLRVGLVTFAFLCAWAAWLVFARTTIYAVSEDGRLLAEGTGSPVQSLVAGIVERNELVLGGSVKAGEVLLVLDAQAEILRRDEEKARLVGLTDTTESVRAILEAERGLADATAKVGASRVNSAGARARSASDVAAYTRQEEEAMRRLRDASLASNLDALHVTEELQRQRGQISIFSADALYASADVGRAVKETEVRMLTLRRELVDLEARTATSRAKLASLEYEIAQKELRSPVDGKVADLAAAPKGSAILAHQVIATIAPDGPLRWVAYFSPKEGIGRIMPNQAARIRLDAFPWTAYGPLSASVLSVGSEPREQRIRVEMKLEGSNPNIPLSNGMTGLTDVEVETTSPLKLLLRLAGQYVQSRPRAVDPGAATPAATAPSLGP